MFPGRRSVPFAAERPAGHQTTTFVLRAALAAGRCRETLPGTKPDNTTTTETACARTVDVFAGSETFRQNRARGGNNRHRREPTTARRPCNRVAGWRSVAPRHRW